MVIYWETVEKPHNLDYKAYNYLILLYAKFVKTPKLDFFDSLWDNMQKTMPFKTCDIIKYHKLPQTTDM